jgi:hypothetical protein
MLRDILSEAFTQIFNDIMPDAAGDKWGNPRFTAFYEKLSIDNSHLPLDDDEIWNIVGEISGGRVGVMALTDKTTPLDLLPILINLLEKPIVFKPSTDTPAGSYAIQLKVTPTEIDDFMTDTGFVPAIYCTIDKALLMVRTDKELT